MTDNHIHNERRDEPVHTEQKEAREASASMMTRRKLLASLGAAGAFLAAEGLLSGRAAGVAYGKETGVTDSVYGDRIEIDKFDDKSKQDKKRKWKDLHGIGLCVATTIGELRSESDIWPEAAYYVTDAGMEGFFLVDENDTVTADNTGTVLVAPGGKRLKRVHDGRLSVLWFGAKGDGITVDTQALQNALNAASGGKLFIPKQRSGYYLTGQLFVRSGTVIEFEPGTVVQAIDTLSRKAPYERLIRILNADNVHICGNGATLQMNKAAYNSGEQAHIFDISGSSNVLIERINANDSGGDGFYVGAFEASQPYSRNIVLRECRAYNNRRQGLSVITVDGLLVENCRFERTDGTAPKSGVDIEPNNTNGLERLKNIRFVGCTAEGNVGRGFLVTLLKLTAASERVDITFENCRTKGNSFGYSVNYGGEGAKAVKGEVAFIGCTAENEQYAGFSVLSNSPESVKTTYVRCKAINCNTVNMPDDPYGFGASFIVTTVPQQPRSAIGNVSYIGCESIDERASGLVVRGFAVKKNKDEAIRNVQLIDCSARGGSQSVYHVDPVAEDVHVRNAVQPVRAVAASGPVSLGWIGHRIHNAGAAGDITLTLPEAKAGRTFTFGIEAAHAVTLVPQSGGAILRPAGGGNAVKSANPGDSIALLGRADGRWQIASAVGSWSEAAAGE
ncbi:right-handed parallel beta-helix repeat-containing protein [Paenibacillus sp. MBLB4367]|uniref:right-handed parallel beta-helix repeat-containing protein n=1 Tax=Paenibacillus sp. MBLB4367 TaxID=3384767 RepID=UPI0039080E9A